MRIWPIYKKELRLYFTSPVAYVLLTIFLLIAGYFFYSIFAFFTRASMQTAMNPGMGRDLNVTDSVLRPLFSNVQRDPPAADADGHHAAVRRGAARRAPSSCCSRTRSATAPCSSASTWRRLTLYGVMLAGTLLYPAILLYFAKVEWGPLATGYLGLLLDGRDVPGHRALRLVADREPDRGRHRRPSASC